MGGLARNIGGIGGTVPSGTGGHYAAPAEFSTGCVAFLEGFGYEWLEEM